MARKETIFGKLHRLMDEQMKALARTMSREEAIEYAARAERIEELLAMVNPDETGKLSGNKESKG
jgi:hypothetical protein